MYHNYNRRSQNPYQNRQQTNPKTTIWIGELDGFEDEDYFKLIFNPLYNIKKIKIIKKNGIKSDYAFIELETAEQAQNLIDRYNNRSRPLSQKPFKINWGVRNKNNKNEENLSSVYIGDLDERVNERELTKIFLERFPSTIKSKIIVEKTNWKRNKCYGFVYFSDGNEAKQAITAMNGFVIGEKPIKTGNGFIKDSPENPQYHLLSKNTSYGGDKNNIGGNDMNRNSNTFRNTPYSNFYQEMPVKDNFGGYGGSDVREGYDGGRGNFGQDGSRNYGNGGYGGENRGNYNERYGDRNYNDNNRRYGDNTNRRNYGENNNYRDNNDNNLNNFPKSYGNDNNINNYQKDNYPVENIKFQNANENFSENQKINKNENFSKNIPFPPKDDNLNLKEHQNRLCKILEGRSKEKVVDDEDVSCFNYGISRSIIGFI